MPVICWVVLVVAEIVDIVVTGWFGMALVVTLKVVVGFLVVGTDKVVMVVIVGVTTVKLVVATVVGETLEVVIRSVMVFIGTGTATVVVTADGGGVGGVAETKI